MIASAIVVTIVLNGAIVASFAPAQLAGGRVVAPLTPVIAKMASRIVYVQENHEILIERATRRIAVPALFEADGTSYVLLAPVVRALGGTTNYDGRTHTLAVDFADERVMMTPAPFDPSAPQASPRVLFTPEPLPPTPRPIDTGAPRPRRTAIPVIPSQPVIERR